MKTKTGFILCTAATFLTSVLRGQDVDTLTFTLGEVIAAAQTSAYRSEMARQNLESEEFDFDSFLASRKWQLGMNFSPAYQLMSVTPEAFAITGYYENNSLLASAGLDFQKTIEKTGGYAYATSSFEWNEFFGSSADRYIKNFGSPRMLDTTPLRIGYRQEFVGYNALKWERKIRNKQMEVSTKKYSAEMAGVSEAAAQYFFSYASEKAMYDMYRVNAESADSLYRIGQEKYGITAIRKDELLSLKLQMMNSLNDVRSSYNSMERARRSLLSFLNLDYDNVAVEIVLPDNPDHLILVKPQEALDIAKEYNPDFVQAESASLIAQQELDKAKREKSLHVDIDLSLGLQKYGYNISSLSTSNMPYTMANVTMAFPLVDHGKRSDNYNAAKSRVAYYDAQEEETERVIKEAIVNTVNEIQIQQQMLEETRKARDLADESFAQNQYNYAQGLSDINTFTLAQNRKDSAHVNYIMSLTNFWLAYYRLCTLTLYDFYNMRPL